MSSLLILGAGYIGGALAARALDAGHEVVLADNWFATERAQVKPLAERGATVADADIRRPEELDALLAARPDRLYLLAAQASRPLSERDPDYTEETNVMGVRRVAEAVARAGGPAIAFASSLHVYGSNLSGHVTADCAYGAQGDLAHVSKVYGELCLRLYGHRHGFGVSLLRLAVVYGPSPVEHDRAESQTVIDKFRRLAAAGEPLPVDDGGRATLGAAHIGDVTRIMLDLDPPDGVEAANVVAETVTVGQVAVLARGEEASGEPAFTFDTPFTYEHDLEGYLRR